MKEKYNVMIISVALMAVASISNVSQSGTTCVLSKQTNVLQTRTATLAAAKPTNAKKCLRVVL
jgi:hypothetical protein